MLEEFVKWMAQLPELERDQKMDVLINLFAPSPSHEDFKRLKGALKRKEKRVKQLEAEKEKAIANLNNDFLRKTQELQNKIKRLTSELNRTKRE